jgi:hypothetical protein
MQGVGGVAVGVLASLCLVHAAPKTDEVTALPGWSGPLPSKHFSGFLNVSYGPEDHNENHLHYVFVEASVAKPATAPVRTCAWDVVAARRSLSRLGHYGGRVF